MHLNKSEKNIIMQEVINGLSFDVSIRKIIVFGSFVMSDDPKDLDLAIFSESDKDYLSLAVEYRRKLRSIANKIPLDIIPIKVPYEDIAFMQEINSGAVIYEKGN